ncbi:MAG: NAD(P)/FAD-dependent oxidoreductase [Candidatus Bathyarchaeia archaeon]
MKSFDAVVVGGGPAGSFTALYLAKLGVKVVVFEEHAEVGVPSHCAGHLSIRSLQNLGLYPLGKGIIENTFKQAIFYSPSGIELSVCFPRPITCSVNRELFDKYLARTAMAAGVHYCFNSRVTSLLLDQTSVSGVRVDKNGGCEDVWAKVVVDAEGVSARLVKQAGLHFPNNVPIVYAVEAEVDNVKDIVLDAVEVFLGTSYAPGFYGWLIPRLDGTAKVGLAARAGNPKTFLNRLIHRHPVASRRLKNAKITRLTFHSIPLGGPLAQAFTGGFLAVGDAAAQVKPTTGGGVILGLTCARIAADVVCEAVRRCDVSADFLKLYQKRCKEAIGFDVAVMLCLRRFVDSLSDKQLDEIFRFCAKIQLSNALKDVYEIDLQGRTLLSLIKKPVVCMALTYFLARYLSQTIKMFQFQM